MALFWGASGTPTAGDSEGRDSRFNFWLQTALFWVIVIPLLRLLVEAWPAIQAAYAAR